MRTKAQMFRDPKARARMLEVAAEYERKAEQSEASEVQRSGKDDGPRKQR